MTFAGDEKVLCSESAVEKKGNTKTILSHNILDRSLVASLMCSVMIFGNPKAMIQRLVAGITQFPNHYTPQFNWRKEPVNKLVVVSILLTGWYFLLKTYVIERGVVDRAHKKYKAHSNTLAVAAHGAGSVLEMCIGCLACCYPKRIVFTKIASALAINNVFSGFVLTPGVFGIKHLTVPGFYLFGVLRSFEIFRTLCCDYCNYPQAWILLQVGTVVRLLGFFVLPFSSIDGVRGDLFTEPTVYSFNILLSGYLTAAFVYPPKWVLSSLLCYSYWYRIQPPRISLRRRLCYDDMHQVTPASAA
jgi:phage shock protein PspC (stress-responsive transcriptional regulator)